jgi:hypothetical protein
MTTCVQRDRLVATISQRLCGPAPGSAGLPGTVEEDDRPSLSDPVRNQDRAFSAFELNSLHPPPVLPTLS